MEEIITPTASRVAPLTPDDRKPSERGRGLRPAKAKSAAATGDRGSKSVDKELAELVSPESGEKHQLDELA